jgi:hypothetical protein
MHHADELLSPNVWKSDFVSENWIIKWAAKRGRAKRN